MYAAEYGQVHAAAYLLQQGASPVLTSLKGDTPLHVASNLADDVELARLLIRHGVPLDAKNTPVPQLRRAAAPRADDVLMLSGVRAQYGHTALDMARYGGRDGIVAELVAAGASAGSTQGAPGDG